MSTADLKDIILQSLDNADEHILKIVAKLLSKNSSDVVAFDANGYPLLLEDYNLKIDEGFKDIKNGNTFSHSEMKTKLDELKRK